MNSVKYETPKRSGIYSVVQNNTKCKPQLIQSII